MAEKITQKMFMDWLRNEFKEADENFIRTEFGKLLKVELKRMGYWKNKARGKFNRNQFHA